MTSKVDLKVVLLGSAMSGKTSLVDRYLYERFTGSNQSLHVRPINVEDVAIKDTAGSERFEAMSKIYYRDAKAAVVCFARWLPRNAEKVNARENALFIDLTDRDSWNKVKFWVREVKEHEPNCLLYVCGTKEDLLESRERALDEAIVKKFCVEHQAVYFETSSRSGNNVDVMFRTVAEQLVNSMSTLPPVEAVQTPADQFAGHVDLTNGPGKSGRRKSGCC